MKRLVTLTLCILAGLLITCPVFASDISNALYSGTVRATNTGTAATNVMVPFTANTSAWIDAGYLNDTATNYVIRNSTGADAKSMPGVDDHPWVVLFSSIPENASKDYYLYTDDVTGSTPVYSPDAAGMSIDDDASMEMTDNGTATLSAYIDTTNTGAWNATTTIIPNGEGDNTTIQSVVGAATHWQATASDDAETSYVYQSSAYGFYQLDLYEASDISESYQIESVTVYGKYETNSAGVAVWYKPAIKTNGTIYYGSEQTDNSGSYVTSDNYTWAKNPYTGETWTAEEINDLQIGANVKANSGAASVRLTYVYAVIAYHQAIVYKQGAYGIYVSDTNEVTANITGASDNITITGVSAGEHDLYFGVDSVFKGMSVDTSLVLPVTDNLVMNAPLWQTDCSSSPFGTIDDNAVVGTVTGADWSNSSGYFFTDGDNDKIVLTDEAAIQNIFDTGGSAGYWVKPTAVNSGDVIATKNGKWLVYLNNPAGNVTIPTFLMDYSGNDGYWSFGTGITVGNWSHVTITMDNTSNTTTPIFYLNGSPISTTVALAPTGTKVSDAGEDITLGNRPALDKDYEGYIAEMRLYKNHVLTADEVLQNYNATKSKYATGDIYVYSMTANITDTANPTIVGGASTPYIESFEVTKGGTSVCEIEWEYDTTFTDLSGNGNDATPSFRTASSDSDVSASLIDFGPITLANASGTADTWPVMMSEAPEEIAVMYTENTTPGFFFAPLFTLIDTYSDGNLPASMLYYMFCFVIILLVGMFAFYIIADKGKQSALLLKIMIMAAFMIFFALPGLNVYGFYVVIYFVMWSFGIMVLSKNYGW